MKYLKSKTISFALAVIFALIQLFLIYNFILNAFCIFAPKVDTLAKNGTVKDVCCIEEETSTNGEEEEGQEEESIEEETTDEETSEQEQETSQNGETDGDGNSSESQGDGEQPQPEPEPEPPPPPEPTVIQCLGDSITYGSPYGGSSSTYPARLQAKLNAAYGAGTTTVINRGVGGYTADQLLGSVSGWLQADNPDIVLLKIGGNDLSACTPENFQSVINQTVSEVQSIVNTIKAHTNNDGSRPKIILSAFIPNRKEGILGTTTVYLYNYGSGPLGINGLNSVSNTNKYFTDNWIDFLNESEYQAYAHLMSDEVHPNSSGYSIMADNWYAQVISFL